MSLYLCTTCFALTDLEHETTQRCNCEEQLPPDFGILDCPSGIHLCWICVRAEAGGESRWSWEACEKCQAANSHLEKKMGLSAALGRHSIMNGVGIPIKKKIEADDPAIAKMMGFIKGAEDLAAWGKEEIKALYESVPAWSRLTHISLEGWEKRFPATSRTSLAALKKFWGLA